LTLFYGVVGPTATGTGVTRTAINSAYRVPAKARELVGVRPWIMSEIPTAAESTIAVWDVAGNDYRHQPCEGLFPVGSGNLGAIDEEQTTPMETWLIHAPLNGTEKLNIGVEPLSALANNGQCGMTLIFSTVRTGRPTIYGKFSREIATGTTAATITAGTNIRVDNGVRMHELCGVAVSGTGTVVAATELAGYFTVKCTGWTPIQGVKFFHAPLHAIEATTGTMKVQSIMRLPFDALFKSKQATIETEAYNYDALGNAGVYAHGVRWIGS